MKRLVVGLAAVTIAASVWGGAVFAGIAISIDGPGAPNYEGYTIGWEFTPNVDIFVDSLGVFDHGSVGLDSSHTVSLWNWDGSQLLASEYISKTHTIPLDAGNVFVSITPVPLSQGQTYVVGTYLHNGDESFRDLNDGTLTAAPELSIATGFRRLIPAQAFPAYTSTTRPVPLGPNFTFYAVPEPSTLAALLGIGLTALLGGAWRRRKAA